MDSGNHKAVQFDHIYRGERHRCAYRVVGDQLAVIVGDKERMTELGRMLPERLAHILVRELLAEAEWAKRAREASGRTTLDGSSE